MSNKRFISQFQSIVVTRQDLTHTVHCYTDKSLRQHVTSQQAAVEYANILLKKNHRVKIFPFNPPKRAIDYIAENEEQYK